MTYLFQKALLASSFLFVFLLQTPEIQAQVSSTLINTGSGTKGTPNIQWKSPTEGTQIVQSEIAQLTVILQTLNQQGADAKTIGQTATKREFYQFILQGLQAGKPLWLAVQDAYASIGGGTDNAADHPFFSLSELQALYDSAVAKLSN
ncbi:MAG: hypothetical protein KA479_05170 [Saprospiraceae bacterium]|nr:hypothetical protein [Saprospiraceae bacterium]